MHFANMGDPRIPAALAPVVKGIVSLNDFRPEAMHKSVRRDYTSAGCLTSTQPTLPGTCYDITPQDDAVIYNTNPLWSQGITGAGQTIAVVEDTDTYNGTGDWSTYMSTFGLSGYGGTYTQVHPVAAPTPAPTATTVKRPSTWKWRQRPRQARPSKTSLARRARSPSAARLPCKT